MEGITELENHHFVTFNEIIDVGKDRQWVRPFKGLNFYCTMGGKPDLHGGSGENSVLGPTETFAEQFLKSTYLNMSHSELLLENSPEYKQQYGCGFHTNFGASKYSTI